MSATVETDYIYLGCCSDCGTASAPCENEEDAEEWAANHNAENHEEYTDEDAADDAREHAREARLGY